ncbi:MAG: YihY/virulence factor BrkB family protein [Cyclobacteriaceae bacterium]|nr:YihY/virulence factor BrkB family protein [Cyclobacteriaceae bacterium]
MSINIGFWQTLKASGASFRNHNGLKLSASLAFYSIFSLGPMMLIIIFVSNLFWSRQAIDGTIYNQISELVGDDSALEIQEIIKESSISGHNFIALISFLTLLIAATGIFTEMQGSINMIWNLKVRPGRGWIQELKDMLVSFLLITGLGLLLLVVLIINGLLEGFMSKLQDMFPATVMTIYVLNLLLTMLVVALLFGVVYKVLPDAVIPWKDAAVGAIFAAVLFMIGKFGITLYIHSTDLGSAYGAAGSLVVLLFWIYYSSVVLYFGAAFTKSHALAHGAAIEPKEYAMTVKVVEVESDEAISPGVGQSI